ncbi:hypothetical protein LZG00_20190 [Rhodobacteraceae bacterium LMO-12]|nr:hypothetical protein [Rhodobacteraceae bacterium LMO-JJ12]
MRLILLLLAIVMAAPVAAQHTHSATGQDRGGPQETGQAAFAALAEIVAILQADPETDWERVDIDGLRRHLVDMDLLTQEAVIARTLRPEGARFEIRGTPRVLEAIRAMVSAHAPFLAAETGWDVVTEDLEDGVALNVDGDAAQIQGLGFFGLMTIGAHHQEHHLMMAKGAAPHH